ncbi:Acyl carrier protein [Halomicronema hongdechloris C2206]|uniref:Acyl carrier protein n=1 Tax=Halomicronema hongdechloris C2206 TaxID=1641165 RepID=A0A1Z3HK20_9CYAN|nr:acyl carrier protein [Halomicronema hongdechloris]ASC70427.1 Acyl carrier protein [Halomicronema hongdechloris C2206]
MSREKIYEQLNTVFQDVFDDDSIKVEDNTSAKDISAWDSMAHINLVLGTEQEFGIKFRTSEVAKLNNVGEFIDLIQNKLAS